MAVISLNLFWSATKGACFVSPRLLLASSMGSVGFRTLATSLAMTVSTLTPGVTG